MTTAGASSHPKKGATTFSISDHQPGARPGIGACPGADERGHGLTTTTWPQNGGGTDA